MATSSGHSQIARTRPRFQLHAIRPRPGHRQGRRRQRGLSENRMDAVSGLKVDPVSLDAPGPRQLGGGQLPLRLTAGEERIGAALAAPGMVFGRVALPSRRSLTLACSQARSTTSQALLGGALAKCRVHDGRLLRDAEVAPPRLSARRAPSRGHEGLDQRSLVQACAERDRDSFAGVVLGGSSGPSDPVDAGPRSWSRKECDVRSSVLRKEDVGVHAEVGVVEGNSPSRIEGRPSPGRPSCFVADGRVGAPVRHRLSRPGARSSKPRAKAIRSGSISRWPQFMPYRASILFPSGSPRGGAARGIDGGPRERVVRSLSSRRWKRLQLISIDPGRPCRPGRTPLLSDW